MNHQNKKNRRSGRKKVHVLSVITVLLAVTIGIEAVLGAVAVAGVNQMLESEPKLKLDDFLSQESTLVYDKDGNQIADVGQTLRENITYDEVPESLIDAFLSIEDSRYFTHNGFDIPRFTASVLNTLLRGNVQGGSTFTMQLVKLTYFQNDENGISRTRDIEYKIQQIDLAIQLEKATDKKTIFELYLNKMNFGGIGNIRGIQKASQQYFGKSVSELNLSDSALMAGIVNSPYYYDPHNFLDHATSRRNEVLDMMLYHGYITQQAHDLAESVRVEDQLIDASSTLDSNGYAYQGYIDEVLKEAAEVTGQDPLAVSMEIHTAMDPAVQAKWEEIQSSSGDIQFYEGMEMGGITINNQTGEIVGIGAGRNYANGGSMLLNHATVQRKQPGSTVKPFLDYAPAIEYLGWATDHQMTDYPMTVGDWQFTNAGNTSLGVLDITTALIWSKNIPALKTNLKVQSVKGIDWYIQYMKDLGFDEDVADRYSLGHAIGGNDFVCTPEQLAAAHGMLLNGGYYVRPHTITSIHYRVGDEPDYKADFERNQVMSSAAAWIVGYMMYQVIHFGGFNYTQTLIRDYQTFAKTGTTDWGDSGLQYGIPQGASKDSWMVCSDTQYTSSIWIGYEKVEEGQLNYLTNDMINANITGNILSEILDVVHRESTPPDYAMPSGVSQITNVLGVFPYVAPTADENLPVGTGYIKSEYAKLGSFSMTVPELEKLSSFRASYNSLLGTVAFSWAPYPGGTEQETTFKSDTTEAEPNLLNTAAITGNVVYKVRLSQNGKTVAEYTSDSETSTELPDLEEDTETQACGYYSYANLSDSTSNEVCTSFRTRKSILPEPSESPEPEPSESPEPTTEPDEG